LTKIETKHFLAHAAAASPPCGIGPKVVLSYAHDSNAELVLLIRRDLEAAGHTPWIDRSDIKSGDAAIHEGGSEVISTWDRPVVAQYRCSRNSTGSSRRSPFWDGRFHRARRKPWLHSRKAADSHQRTRPAEIWSSRLTTPGNRPGRLGYLAVRGDIRDGRC
jgi:hypothetical protein